MPVIHFGNHRAVHHDKDGNRLPLEGTQITEFNIPDGVYTMREMMRTLTHPREGQWQVHSDADNPLWVHCSDPELEAALMDFYGCRAGGPDDYLHRVDELHLMPRRDDAQFSGDVSGEGELA